MSKKIRATIYVVGVLWIAVMSQLLVNRLFMNDSRIMDAFIDSDTNIRESKLNLVVDYGNSFLLNNQREEVLTELADTMGIKGYTISKDTKKDTVTVKLEQKSKKLSTTMEFITLTQKQEQDIKYQHFILMEMQIHQKYKDIIDYKKAAEKEVKKLKCKDYQCIMKFTGSYHGRLSEKQRDQYVKEMLQNLQAKKVDSISENGYYTVYAYTGLVDDYIKADGKRININIAITYDEETDETQIVLATPILNEEY